MIEKIHRCGETVALLAGEHRFLVDIPDTDHEAPTQAECLLDRHDGRHSGFVQSVTRDTKTIQEWWLQWSDIYREIVELPACEVRGAEDPDPLENVCCNYFAAHPGRHSFEQRLDEQQSPDPVAPVPSSIRLCINLNPRGGQSEQWESQRRLVAYSGADFDPQTRRWYLWLSPGDSAAKRLNPLFEAARLYGTAITVDREPDPAADTPHPPERLDDAPGA